MQINVKLNTHVVDGFIKAFPDVAEEEIGKAVKKIGYKLKAESTKDAPVITGNLRRSIRFIESSKTAGVLKAFANYAPYVHGNPFYQNRMKRRETPFFTSAEASSRQFIERAGDSILVNIVKRLN